MEYLTFISDYENIESQLIDIYETNLTKDIDRKITGYGVHKDDWQIKVDEKFDFKLCVTRRTKINDIDVEISFSQIVKIKNRFNSNYHT